MFREKRILVTGASGFLGRHLLPVLEKQYGREQVVGISSRDYDLMDPAQVNQALTNIRPHTIVHLAAYSGGILANQNFPADFFYRNTLLTVTMFEAAARHQVKKLLYPMGGCSYPAKAQNPIDESQMWDGFPQAESAPYSLAKKMGIVASQAYRRQRQLQSTVLVLGNLYGEYDNFSLEGSHVIPAMIRKIHEANLAGTPEVSFWGSGLPTRDFVYAGDVAGLFPYFIETFQESGPINVATQRKTSMAELAEMISRTLGFQGRILWDREKPDGQREKIYSVAKLLDLGLSCPTSLTEGLERTVAWFKNHYASRSDGIRL